MNKKQREKIGRVVTGILAVAMMGGLFGGLTKAKNTGAPKENERVTYEDGFKEYQYGDIIEVKDFVLAAHIRDYFSKDIKTGKDSSKKSIEGEEFFIIEGAMQKRHPGILNLYKQVITADLIVEGEKIPLKISLGEDEENYTAHTFSSSDEVTLLLYASLTPELKEKMDTEYSVEFVYGNEELAKESGIQKYRMTIKKELNQK